MSGTSILCNSDDDPFNQTDVLLNIGHDLTEHNVDSIKFLIAEDMVPLGTLETLKKARDLIDHLQNECDLKALLRELLYTIGRHDLMKRYYNKEKSAVQIDLANQPIKYISPYRKLLHSISEELDSNAVADLKLLCSGKISKGDLQSINSGYALFLALEKQREISKHNVEFLQNILIKARRKKLAFIVEKYQTDPSRHADPVPHDACTPAHADPEPEDWMVPPVHHTQGPKLSYSTKFARLQSADNLNVDLAYRVGDVPYGDSDMTEDGTRVTKEQLETQLAQLTQELESLKLKQGPSMLKEYCMTNSPRGHCVIINNMNFIKKDYRKGSEIDCEALETRFNQLNFTVRIEQNLNKKEVEDLVYEYRKMDHSKFDCFAVCVLSHGKQDHFFCADDQDYSIQGLMRNFSATNCPSLAGKPKIFFIQACQGNDRMLATSFTDDLQTDGDSPDMVDMVLAQSTFPGHVAFRSRKEGSWFISALCDVLYQCHSELHLTDMLIEVNRRVAEAKALKGETFYKQCPAPMITLRKAVWFRSNTVVCQPSY